MMRRLPTQTSAGLTTSVTAYTSGDVLGGLLTFPNAVSAAGGRGVVRGFSVADAAGVLGAVDLMLFGDVIAAPVDNAVHNVSDADMLKFDGGVSATTVFAGSAGVGVSAQNVSVPYDCVGTTLYGLLITRTANSFFVAATDLRVTLFVDDGTTLAV